MAFGFDPSIILSGLPRAPAEPTLNDTLQTLASLTSHRMQQQQAQASLADMLRKREQENTLAGIFRANADTPDALAGALMRGGFGAQAFAAQDQLAEMGVRRAQEAAHQANAAKDKQAMEAAYRKQIGEHFHGATPADYPDRLRALAASSDPLLAAYAKTLPETADAAALKRIQSQAFSAKEQAEIEDKATVRTETERHNREMEKRPSGMPALMLVTGEGGTQYFADPRNPTAPAKVIKDEGGEPVVKPSSSEDKYAERNVGGYNFNRKNPPTAEGAKKMANVLIARDKALGALGRLEALFDEHGTQLYGEVASQMESEWKQITDQIRIQGEMGVPNGADYPMLAKQIPNPVGVEGKKQLPASIKAKFGVLRKQLKETVDATAKAYKYFPDPAPGEPPRVSSEKEYNNLPAGTEYIDARDGKRKRKS